jgi:hypothetical protein
MNSRLINIQQTLVNEIQSFDFQALTIEPEFIGRILTSYVKLGSDVAHLTKDDLLIVNYTDENIVNFSNLKQALDCGTPLFDAIIYFSFETKPQIKKEEYKGQFKPKTHIEIGRSVFYVYFYLMIRGRAPSRLENENKEIPPKFLTKVLNYNLKAHEYIQTIAGFDLNLLDSSWIRYIPIPEMSDKAKNRFYLGLSGYRYLAALFAYPPTQEHTDDVKISLNILKEFYERGPVWDCHSVTRTQDFLTLIINFNRNLTDLIFKIHNKDQIELMKKVNLIHKDIVQPGGAMNWQNWTYKTFSTFTDFVFESDKTKYQKFLAENPNYSVAVQHSLEVTPITPLVPQFREQHTPSVPSEHSEHHEETDIYS